MDGSPPRDRFDAASGLRRFRRRCRRRGGKCRRWRWAGRRHRSDKVAALFASLAKFREGTRSHLRDRSSNLRGSWRNLLEKSRSAVDHMDSIVGVLEGEPLVAAHIQEHRENHATNSVVVTRLEEFALDL